MSYPVLFDLTKPERHDRVQLVLRAVILLVLGLIGLSVGWLVLLLYLVLPAAAAVVIQSKGGEGYLRDTAPGLTRLSRWLLSFVAYMALLTDRFPTGEGTLVRFEVEPGGAPTARSALMRLLVSLPEMIVLAVLGIVSAFVWIFGVFSVVVAQSEQETLFGFQKGLLRWAARLLAYHASLVDTMPPLAIDTGPEGLTH